MNDRFRPKTSWRAKLDKDQPRKLVPASTGFGFGPGILLIPRPSDVDAVIRKVRRGKLVTIQQIRARLAADFNSLPIAERNAALTKAGVADRRADSACPLCTGIFLRIAAEAAEEDRRAGKTRITPYWRVVRDDGSLHEKFPGGPRAQADHLRAEGHRLEPARGKKPPKVRDFDRKLAKL